MYWKSDINMELVHFSRYHIDMTVKEGSADPWRLTSICGEAQMNERQKTWDHLEFFVRKSDLVCIGDYNEILHVEEHDGVGQRDKRQMLGFREAVDVTGSV